MKTIGELVQEAIDLSGRNLFEAAFVPLCEALDETARKIFENSLPEPPYQKFIDQNWRLISFMSVAPQESLPLNLPFLLRRAISSFNSPHALEELIIFLVRQTLTTHRLLPEIGFIKGVSFKIEGDRLQLPQSFFFALLSSVVLHPVNKKEIIPDKYWIQISDFKMFISELWGRIDIAERIMQLYS